MPIKNKKVVRSENKKSSEAFSRVRALEREIAVVIRELEQTVRQFDCLSRFTTLVASDASSEVLIQVAQETSCQLLQCESASIELLDLKSQKRSELLPTPLQLKSFLEVPIQIGQVTLGVIRVMNKIPSLLLSTPHQQMAQFSSADQRILAELARQLAIGLENSTLKQKLKKSFAETVEVLSEAVSKKDRYTGGHTKRVAHYSCLIAKYLDLTPQQVETVRHAAVLHDVGKIGIEDKILKKNGPLDDAEWAVMKTHPVLGYEILSSMEENQDAIVAAHYHHERWDGKGYPKGLKGEEIPLAARIVALADAYDAMVSNRPYRQGVDPSIAYEEIIRNKGTQFDPQVVDAFITAFRLEKMNKGSGGGNSGAS
jgi:putative nucleotidyltransferase with HDIG domain